MITKSERSSKRKSMKCYTCDRTGMRDGDCLGFYCWECVDTKNIDSRNHTAEVRQVKSETKSAENGKKEVVKKRSQKRMGQCKAIDELLEKGMSIEQIVQEITKRFPEYPQQKIKPLVKVRISHRKIKGV